MKSTPQAAIRKTIRYASFFDFELTEFETYLYLISPQTYPLPKKIFLLSPSRLKLKKISQRLFNQAEKVARLLQKFPTINLIAVTGSLAMENAKRGDDLDLMIVTQKNTLWLTRLFIVPLVRLFFKARVPRKNYTSGAVCLNLWLDDSSLAIPKSKRNLYIAHEVLQIKPLFNRNFTYERFIRANIWTKHHLANFYTYIQDKHYQRKITPRWNIQGASLKGGRQAGPRREGRSLYIISFLNLLSFLLQYLYMLPKMTHESVSLHSAYFHPKSLASKLTQHLETTP